MAKSFKFSTFLWIVAGLLIPLWPVSLPLCWFLAYRSYVNGDEPKRSLADLQAAVELNKAGAVSDEELARIKASTLGR